MQGRGHPVWETTRRPRGLHLQALLRPVGRASPHLGYPAAASSQAGSLGIKLLPWEGGARGGERGGRLSAGVWAGWPSERDDRQEAEAPLTGSGVAGHRSGLRGGHSVHTGGVDGEKGTGRLRDMQDFQPQGERPASSCPPSAVTGAHGPLHPHAGEISRSTSQSRRSGLGHPEHNTRELETAV